jgi:membrane fusion protein (multidrug efflux system)
MLDTSPRLSRRLIAAFAIATYLLLPACGNDQGSGARQMPTPEVRVVTLQRESLTLTRDLPGRTRAYLVAEVRPQVTGVVRERVFEEGSRVEAGEPLYQLDDALYRTAFQSAEAGLERAKAAQAIAELNAGRAESVVASGAVSDQELRNLQAAQAQAEAEVAVARAQLESARVRLGYARIRAPIAGRTGKSTVTPGALVTADQSDALTTVQQLDPIYVDVVQSATELLNLRRRLNELALQRARAIPVRILLNDDSQYEHEGKLLFEDATVDPSTGSVAFRIVVPNPDHLLLPGMYVRAQVSTAIIEDALLVPQRGITRDPRGNATAMLLNAANEVEQRDVEVREAVGDRWLVAGGLEEGDRVIVEGLQKIRVGQPARLAPAEASGD